MARVPKGAPLSERGGRLGGVLDLAAGRYPGFLFGLPVGHLLPVFHFHESTETSLTPAFTYLVDNGYRTIVSDDLTRWVRDGVHPGPKTVMLCFDDALASLWLVVAPLLRRFGLRAVTYAIPGRMTDAPATRLTLGDGPVDAASADRAPNPFVTWPELRALANSGLVDVQSHTLTHAMIFTSPDPIGVVTPDYATAHFMNRPAIGADDEAAFLDPARLGYPLFPSRSRMSDGRRFRPSAAYCADLESWVRNQGGAAFFKRQNAQSQLAARFGQAPGETECESDQQRAIERQLAGARDVLESRIGRPVQHVCLPWGVSGHVTRSALARLGFQTAFANRRPGRLAVAAGDDPFFLKRLHERHVFALPGRGRRVFVTLA